MKSSYQIGDLVILKKEYYSRYGVYALILKQEAISAPPLGIPKHMCLVLMDGRIRKIPAFFIDRNL
jgi:hypothetical protein